MANVAKLSIATSGVATEWVAFANPFGNEAFGSDAPSSLKGKGWLTLRDYGKKQSMRLTLSGVSMR